MSEATAGERWFEAAFRADYLRVYPHRDVEAARREVEFLVARGLGGRVLDLCCGFGRHVLALRAAGIAAFGVDLSLDLLRAARTLEGSERELAGHLVRADAARVPFRDACCDGLVNLFSSFGYFGDSGDRRVLAEIARVVRPGGIAIFDLMNPPRVRAELVPHSRRREPDFVLDERRELRDGGRRVVKDVELAFADGRRLAWREDVRLYDAGEFEALLAEHGFALRARYGDFDGSPWTERSPRALVLAERRGVHG